MRRGPGPVPAGLGVHSRLRSPELALSTAAPQGEDEAEYQGPSAGCTAVCAVVRGNVLVVANAGDSRCVLSRRGMAVALTQDHKPNDEEEYARILKVRAQPAACMLQAQRHWPQQADHRARCARRPEDSWRTAV